MFASFWILETRVQSMTLMLTRKKYCHEYAQTCYVFLTLCFHSMTLKQKI